MNRRAMLRLCGVLAAAFGFSSAQATVLNASEATPGAVLYDQTQPVLASSFATSTTLKVPSAGELFVTLTDEKAPEPFASLQFALTDATAILNPLSNAGVLTLDLTTPMTVYADVFATTQGGAGLYNLEATFVGSSSVPLPTSATSLVCGLLALLLALCNSAIPGVSGRAQVTVTSPVA